jgi:hypothetical protein
MAAKRGSKCMPNRTTRVLLVSMMAGPYDHAPPACPMLCGLDRARCFAAWTEPNMTAVSPLARQS